jgi:hypothetical protein
MSSSLFFDLRADSCDDREQQIPRFGNIAANAPSRVLSKVTVHPIRQNWAHMKLLRRLNSYLGLGFAYSE